MIQSTNFPLSKHCLQAYGGWEAVEEEVKTLGVDGLEVIADPDDLADDIPLSLVAGYHMTFFADWVDFWRQDKNALQRKFRSQEEIEAVYRGTKPEDLLRHYQNDLALARRLKAPYLVYHVSDVSLEEGYTYRWLHTDKEVLDASIEFINELLKDTEPTFELLLENQWWPGFKFTEPALTDYLLSRINYPRVGIMLDTGHLMNTNWKLRTQWQGVKYILEMIEKHGELSKSIYGLHFHQSMSGAYCRKNVGKLPEDFPLEWLQEYARNYAHILQIDRHRPWTEEECVMILGRVQPKYLTHEISSSVYHGKKYAIWRQKRKIRRGYQLELDKKSIEEVEQMRIEARKEPELTGNYFLDHVIRQVF